MISTKKIFLTHSDLCQSGKDQVGQVWHFYNFSAYYQKKKVLPRFDKNSYIGKNSDMNVYISYGAKWCILNF